MPEECVREQVRTRMTGTAVLVLSVVLAGFWAMWRAHQEDLWNAIYIYDNLEELEMDMQLKAKTAVVEYFNEKAEITDEFQITVDDVYVVWFSKTLQNWKALVSTTVNDGMYYELTYNGDKGELYLDAYKKFDNVRIEDDPIATLREKLSTDARPV